MLHKRFCIIPSSSQHGMHDVNLSAIDDVKFKRLAKVITLIPPLSSNVFYFVSNN